MNKTVKKRLEREDLEIPLEDLVSLLATILEEYEGQEPEVVVCNSDTVHRKVTLNILAYPSIAERKSELKESLKNAKARVKYLEKEIKEL